MMFRYKTWQSDRTMRRTEQPKGLDIPHLQEVTCLVALQLMGS